MKELLRNLKTINPAHWPMLFFSFPMIPLAYYLEGWFTAVLMLGMVSCFTLLFIALSALEKADRLIKELLKDVERIEKR